MKTKNNLDYFKKFVPKDEEKAPNYLVWSYTRVSTKDQYENNGSVTRQKEANRNFAENNNYIIAEEFGGTYESAKSDFTRKEFKRLIDRVTAAKRRPYAILVYRTSRFSRSGGNAIGLVHTLVEDLGVHLVEVSSGISTTTERGKAAIYERLFDAYKENLERKEIIIPAMVSFFQKGNICGRAPLGYDHYGKNVRKDKYLSLQQRIVVNKDGELLREAWKWKASGFFSDAQIMGKLAARGLHIPKQRMSDLWRNPFYCGVLVNRLLEEPVKGNWEPLVSMEDFVKVQNLIEDIDRPGCHPGYTQNKQVEPRPLTRLLRCHRCKNFMVGYENKKKNLHYYKCHHCEGVSLNAMTTPKAKRKGANELFMDFLNKFRLPSGFIPLIKLQLTQIFDHLNAGHSKNDEALQSQLEMLEQKRKQLTIRHGLGEIDKETYEITSAHLTNQMQNVNKEMMIVFPQKSNLEKMISVSLQKLENLSVIWASNDLERKRIMHKTLFPDGIFYDAEKHECLTTQTNGFITLTNCLAEEYKQNKKPESSISLDYSVLVENIGVEPTTSCMPCKRSSQLS
jgi:site-specific DNA recombinase